MTIQASGVIKTETESDTRVGVLSVVQMFMECWWAGRLETKCFHTVTVNSPPASPPSPSPPPRPPPPGGLSELRPTWAPGRLRSSPGRGAVINASGTRLAAASEPCQQPTLRGA